MRDKDLAHIHAIDETLRLRKKAQVNLCNS